MVKDCHAWRLICWFESLPERDERGPLRKLWHKLGKKPWHTQESFWLDNPRHGTYGQLLNRNIIENRAGWKRSLADER